MKLDRNLNADGRGKYGLVKNRVVAEIMAAGGGLSDEVQKAMDILTGAGVLDQGTTPDTEFFAVRLRDRFAAAGLFAYATAAHFDDPEYAMEVNALALRAGPKHPNSKVPD